jgi:hypothetical protein
MGSIIKDHYSLYYTCKPVIWLCTTFIRSYIIDDDGKCLKMLRCETIEALKQYFRTAPVFNQYVVVGLIKQSEDTMAKE